MNEYKNKEELYFSYYLDELKKAKLIKNYTYEEETFELSPKVEFDYQKITQLKTKLKIEDKSKTLFQPCTYNPDFIIEGQKMVIELFGDYWHKGENPKDRIKEYDDVGYKCLILWESEIYDKTEIAMAKVEIFLGGILENG